MGLRGAIDWALCAAWFGLAVWTLAKGEPVDAGTAAMLSGLIALGFAASARRG